MGSGACNRYSYARADPVGRIDPQGLQDEDPVFSVTAFLIPPALSTYRDMIIGTYRAAGVEHSRLLDSLTTGQRTVATRQVGQPACRRHSIGSK